MLLLLVLVACSQIADAAVRNASLPVRETTHGIPRVLLVTQQLNSRVRLAGPARGG
jgi:hypothetical protein